MTEREPAKGERRVADLVLTKLFAADEIVAQNGLGDLQVLGVADSSGKLLLLLGIPT
jgi:hypothetical protein